MIDLSRMRQVEVDAGAKIARAQGGSTWLDFDSATQAFGLVTPGGVVGSTGVTGLTLGKWRAARPAPMSAIVCRGRPVAWSFQNPG